MIKLLHGDCLEKMKDISDKSIDMILCDLPYGTTACKWDVIIPFEPLWKEYKRIIKDRGCIALFGSEPFSSALRMSNIKNYKYDWKWEKSKPTGFMLAKKQPIRNSEDIMVFYSKQPTYNPIKWFPNERFLDKRKTYNKARPEKGQFAGNHKERTPDDGSRLPTTIIGFESFWAKDMHPTQKPVALLEYLIKTYTQEGETVLDNCMGSGSTGVACINTNRNFIGIEKEENYFNIAKKRIEEAEQNKREDI